METANKVNYWIGVASKDHVERGVSGGFCQLCHGKARPLRRMKPGDWIIYYSPKEKYGKKLPCQQFTAVGKITGESVYKCEMAPGFIPNRRDVHFFQVNAVPVKPLIDKLSFIKDKNRWGYAFRYGHFQIQKNDFRIIVNKMINDR